MAINTPREIRNLVIYEIFTRNHSPAGTFAEVERDLDRIRSMGVDVIWFMPVHPIGATARKGTLGSPYSIQDYRKINPELGTEADFSRLIQKAHSLGLRVMIDVVYNHTAHDSRLVKEHPDWFHRGPDGLPESTVPEWSDVVDLKVPNPELADELIDTLEKWVGLGVDGFRCDVASIVPLSFWIEARRRVDALKPGVIWMAESVHAEFVSSRRSAGLTAASDGELYQAFDITYDYDIWPIWAAAVRGEVSQGRYLEMLRFQDCIYPANYAKLRCVENHDQTRIQKLAGTPSRAAAWTAFMAFNQGPFLIYAGMESAARHTPSLFERDPIDWGDHALQPEISGLARIKKEPVVLRGMFSILEAEPVIQAAWHRLGEGLYGIFNPRSASGRVSTRLQDGAYVDLLTGVNLEVQNHEVAIPETAAILRFKGEIDTHPFHSVLLKIHD